MTPAPGTTHTAQATGPSAATAPAALVAELLGISDRAVRERCYDGQYGHRTVPAPGGGRRLEVALVCLPEAVQVRAIARLAGDAGTPGPGDGEPAPLGTAYERASATEKAEADRRLTILQQWDAFAVANGAGGAAPGPQGRIRSRLLAEYVRTQRAAGVRLSRSSLYTWLAAYAARGLDGLVPSYGGGGTSTVTPQWRSLFLQCWGCEQQPTITTAYRATLVLAEKAGLHSPPKLSAVRYLVDHLTAEERIMLRQGPRAVRSLLLPYIQRDWEGCLPLEWWCMDHTPLDLLALDEESGRVCRPYLTTLMDMGTRRGCVTVCRVPNQNTVLWTLAKAIMAWGAPANLYVDNGKDFRAAAVTGGKKKRVTLALDEGRCRSLCDRLQIQAHFATAFNAQAKPVERWHRTIEQNLAVFFESYVGNRPDKKPEGLLVALKAGEVPTFREVERVVTGWIEGVYHTTPHAGLKGRTPDQVWAERIGQVQVVQRTTEELKYLLLKVPKPVTVSRYQIRLFGRCYEAAPETPDCLFGYHGRPVVPHYDPRDITRIFLTLADDTPVGWVVEKRLAAIGPAGEDVIVAARREQKKVRQALRTHLADVAAGLVEPDRVARHAIRQAQDRARGGEPVGQLPPASVARPKLVQLPLADATRAAAALAAVPPARPAPRDVAAEHAAAVDEILATTTAAPAGPAPVDAYDTFFDEVTGS